MNRIMGAILLALLIAYASIKADAGALPELLWASHVTSALLAIGLLLNLPALTAIGFLYHLGVALPAYALHLLVGGDTNWASIALHTLSPMFGWIAWHSRRVPVNAIWHGWVVYLILVVLSRAFTPEALNVNLAFKPWQASPMIGMWPNRVLNALLVLVQLGVGYWMFGWVERAWQRRVANAGNSTG